MSDGPTWLEGLIVTLSRERTFGRWHEAHECLEALVYSSADYHAHICTCARTCTHNLTSRYCLTLTPQVAPCISVQAETSIGLFLATVLSSQPFNRPLSCPAQIEKFPPRMLTPLYKTQNTKVLNPLSLASRHQPDVQLFRVPGPRLGSCC